MGQSEVGEPQLKVEAPVFRPSPAEFADVLGYIASIRPLAEPFGLAKIIPPQQAWSPKLGLHLTESLTFKTRVQRIDELHKRLHSTQESEAWWVTYKEYCSRSRTHKKFVRPPTIGRRPVDLFKLYRAVERRGGYKGCCEKESWGEVARIVQVRLEMMK